MFELKGHSKDVNYLTLLKDGRLASSSDDETIRIWNLTTGQTVRILSGHTTPVYYVVELSDGRLASGSFDSTIMIWDKIN